MYHFAIRTKLPSAIHILKQLQRALVEQNVMDRVKQISLYLFLISVCCLLSSETISAQSFLTEDYPEYAYQVKLQSQHALFNKNNYPSESSGIFNLSSTIPLSHITAIYFNIPFQANYDIPEKNTIEFGNFEFSLQLRTLNREKRSSVYSLGIFLPLHQETNPFYFGWNTYLYNYGHPLEQLLPPASSCLTDYPRSENYLTGYGGTKISYAFHIIEKRFMFMARFKSCIMICKRRQQPTVGPWFFNSELKGGYMIGNFTVIMELLNTFFTGLNDDYQHNDLEDNLWWTGAAGLTYDYKWMEAGVFFQLNMNHEFHQYAPYVIGVQLMATFDKKEAFLKVKKSE